MSRTFRFAALLTLVFSGCSCSDDPAGNDGQDSSTNTGRDGSVTNNDGTTNDGSDPNGDGSDPNGDGSEPRDGGEIGDGGDPLNQPLSEFCNGMGSVVIVGEADTCAGE